MHSGITSLTTCFPQTGPPHQEIQGLVIIDNRELLYDIRKNKSQLTTIKYIISISGIIQS